MEAVGSGAVRDDVVGVDGRVVSRGGRVVRAVVVGVAAAGTVVWGGAASGRTRTYTRSVAAKTALNAAVDLRTRRRI